MPALGAINSKSIIGSTRLGLINSNTLVNGLKLGQLHNTDSITLSSQSPSSYQQKLYTASKNAWIYECPGYHDNTDLYPVIFNWVGYGATDRDGGTFANVNNSGEGLGYYLLAGDKPPGVLIITPQNLTYNVDYGVDELDAAVAYMMANYRVDPNRFYGIGLSGGAIALQKILQFRTSTLAAMIAISGPSLSMDWSTFNGIGVWHHQGAKDSTFGRTIGGTLYWANGGFSSWNELTPAPRGTYYYNKGHDSSVWSYEVFNRKFRTDAAGTSQFDYVQWLSKHNKDQTLRATQFTANAETTFDIADYREAKQAVDNLSSGSTKTSLLARLAALRTTINKSGKRYFISFQNTSIGPVGSAYNLMTSFGNGATITNLVDEDGNPDTLSLTINNQFASTTRDDAASSDNAAKMKSKGHLMPFFLSGLVVNPSITTGSGTIGGVPSLKKVDVIYHHHHVAADDDNNAITTESRLNVTMNGVTKSQYSAYQNAYYMQFNDVPEVGGNVVFAANCGGLRNVLLQGIEIVVHN